MGLKYNQHYELRLNGETIENDDTVINEDMKKQIEVDLKLFLDEN